MQDRARQMLRQATGVLLLDGHEGFQRSVESFLRRQPYLEILGVLGPGEDPQALAEDLHSAVVLVDLEAPDLDSLAMIGWLREAVPGLGIVALSLSEDNAHRQAVLRAGADALVYKARLVQDLMPAIRRARLQGSPEPSIPLTNLGT